MAPVLTVRVISYFIRLKYPDILNFMWESLLILNTKTYAEDSLVAGRATVVGQLLSDVSDRAKYPGSQDRGLGMGL